MIVPGQNGSVDVGIYDVRVDFTEIYTYIKVNDNYITFCENDINMINWWYVNDITKQ